MNKLTNYILNRFISPRLRYKKILSCERSSRLLPNFLISTRIINREQVKIGDNCLIGAKFIIESPDANIILGNNVFIGDSALIAKSAISIGNNVLIAWGVTIYDHDSHSLDSTLRQKDIEQALNDYKNYSRDYLRNKDWSLVNSKPIVIEDDVWIGFNVIVLKGVRIGRGSIVAAGSVVTKDVPPFVVAAGNPAVVVKKI